MVQRTGVQPDTRGARLERPGRLDGRRQEVLAEPAPGADGAVAQFVRGIRVAAEHVTETDAALLWPGAMSWVDAETATTLIERHGLEREQILRPRYDENAGWPILLPTGPANSPV